MVGLNLTDQNMFQDHVSQCQATIKILGSEIIATTFLIPQASHHMSDNLCQTAIADYSNNFLFKKPLSAKLKLFVHCLIISNHICHLRLFLVDYF